MYLYFFGIFYLPVILIHMVFNNSKRVKKSYCRKNTILIKVRVRVERKHVVEDDFHMVASFRELVRNR